MDNLQGCNLFSYGLIDEMRDWILEHLCNISHDTLVKCKFFRDDFIVVKKVVNKYSCALKDASERLRDNKEIVMTAINGGMWNGFGRREFALKYASDRLRDDEEIIMKSVKRNGRSLRFASDRLRDTEAVVFAAVECEGGSLKHASQRLRNNKEIIKAAVRRDPCAIKHASQEFKDTNKRLVYVDYTSE